MGTNAAKDWGKRKSHLFCVRGSSSGTHRRRGLGEVMRVAADLTEEKPKSTAAGGRGLGGRGVGERRRHGLGGGGGDVFLPSACSGSSPDVPAGGNQREDVRRRRSVPLERGV